jgi:WD40 repeat protein
MAHLLNSLFFAFVFVLMTGRQMRADEPAAQSDTLPAGAVARLGTSRFLNYGRLFSVAFSRDGKLLVGGAWDGTVRIWDVTSGKQFYMFQDQNGPVRAVAFSPDGKLFACPGKGNEIVLRETASGQELGHLKGHTNTVTHLEFAPDGKVLASNGIDHTLRLWKLASGRELRQLTAQDPGRQGIDPDCPIAFSPDGKTITSATVSLAGSITAPQRTFRVWELANGGEVRSILDNSPWHGAAAISPDGKLLAALAYGRQMAPRISLWDLGSGEALPSIELGQRVANRSFLVFSPDSKTLASSGDGPIQLWELATRREFVHFPSPDTGTCCLAFSPNGRLLASGSTDTTSVLWDVTGRLQNGKLALVSLPSQKCQTLWEDLGGTDATRATHALWEMVAAGNEGVAFLHTRLHPVASPASKETISSLLVDLDSADYAIRSRATGELLRLGELAEPALMEAQRNHPSLERRRRIDQLAKAILESRTKPSGDRLRSWRAVEILEQIGTPQARQLLEALSRGAAGALQTGEAHAALARLERLEPSAPASR